MSNVLDNLLSYLYSGIFSLFNLLINIVFLPIDALLDSIIPNYSALGQYIDSFFDYFQDTIYFVLSWLHIPVACLDIIIGYISFRVLLYFGTLSFKLFIKWYNLLKL